MISFSGDYSEKGRKFILKKYFFMMLGVGLFAVILGCLFLVLTIITTMKSGIDTSFGVLVAATVVAFIMAILIFLLPWSTRKNHSPTRIEINDSYVTCYFNNFVLYGKEKYSSFEDIKEIVDYGEYYYFSFYYPHKIVSCVCQKDLLVEGTLEEFENLFEDKIIRKE